MSGPQGLVILAGGENSRLRPLSSTIYKAFLPIHGVSLVARQVMRATMFGIPTIIVVTDEPDVLLLDSLVDTNAESSVDLLTQPGSMAIKILRVAEQFPAWRPMLICLGDTFAKVDLSKLFDAPAEEGVDSALCAVRYRIPYGVIDADAKHVRAFREKPLTQYLANTGYMALGDRALDHLRDKADLASTLEAIAEEGQLTLSEVVEECTMIDDLFDLARAHEKFANAAETELLL